MAIALFAGTAQADLSSDLLSCKSEPDSLKRLTCFDRISVEDQASASKAAPVQTTSSPITMTNVVLRVQKQDYKKDVFNPRIEALPTFKNDSKKTVVAVEHTLVITDAFGDNVIDSVGKLDVKIPPGETVQSDTFYFWDDNPFIANEPYDKLYGPIGTGVAKTSGVVTKVVFSDGSVETYQ